MTIEPTLYELKGTDAKISFATSSIAGLPTFEYQHGDNAIGSDTPGSAHDRALRNDDIPRQ